MPSTPVLPTSRRYGRQVLYERAPIGITLTAPGGTHD